MQQVIKTNTITDILEQLKSYGLRITEPRKKLLEAIFLNNNHHHIIAEVFHVELKNKGIKLSLATVYNTLNVLSSLGLLKRIKTGNCIIFDTNISHHGHLINELTGEVEDLDFDEYKNVLIEIINKHQIKSHASNINFLITVNK